MKAVIADQKRRVTLPGDVFDVQITREGSYVLEKLVRPSRPKPPSADQVRRALAAAPLNPAVSWEKLRRLTREP